MIPLNAVNNGETVSIESLNGGKVFIQRISDLGFTKNTELTVLDNSFCGPILIKIKESRIAIGQGEANKIIVSKK